MTMAGKHHSIETKAKISKAHTGKKRKPRSAEYCKNISKALKGRKLSAEHCKAIGKAVKKRYENPAERKKVSDANKKRFEDPEQRRKISGSNSANWIDGKSLEKRPSELTFQYRQSIRRRDDFICAMCDLKVNGKHERFPVHHIDHNRENNHPDNLITLCKSCHEDTQFNREANERFCKNLMKRIKCQNPKGHRESVELYEKNMKLYYQK